MSLVMVFVVLLSLAAGIGLGYAIIFSILYIFDRSRQSIQARPVQALNLSAGGD